MAARFDRRRHGRARRVSRWQDRASAARPELRYQKRCGALGRYLPFDFNLFFAFEAILLARRRRAFWRDCRPRRRRSRSLLISTSSFVFTTANPTAAIRIINDPNDQRGSLTSLALSVVASHFQLPTISAPPIAPNWRAVKRDSPLHIWTCPGLVQR